MAQVIISKLPPLPDGTGSGTPLGTDLTPGTDVTDTTEAATGTTKKYTRSAEFNFYLNAMGITAKTAVTVATTAGFTVIYANGVLGVGATLTNAGAQAALTIDGIAMVVGYRVLVKNQASQAQNGIYVVTNIGSGATNWILTRATDYDQAAEIHQGDVVLVNQGTVNASLLYQETGASPFTIGTTPIIFTRYSISTSSFLWFTITAASQSMAVNNGYIANSAGLVSLLLPATSSVGDEIAVSGLGAGGWSITQNAGQNIQVGSVSSTVGVGGSVSSTNRYDSLRMVCLLANTTWAVSGGIQGIVTIV